MIEITDAAGKNRASESGKGLRACVLLVRRSGEAKSRLLIVSITLTLFGAGMTAVRPAFANTGGELASKVVLIVRSHITYEDLLTGEQLDSELYDGINVQANLDSSVQKVAGMARLNTVECGSLKVAESADLCGDLRPLVSKYASGRDHDDATELLARLSEARSDLVLMSVSLRVKVGPGGSWDPNSGFITTTASTSHFQASLIEVNTGKVLWQNEVLFRKLPRVNRRKYEKALLSLFSNFPGIEEK